MPLPTKIRMWLKEQMRAIENQTLSPICANEIFAILEEMKHNTHAKVVNEIINELASEKKKKTRRGGKKHKKPTAELPHL